MRTTSNPELIILWDVVISTFVIEFFIFSDKPDIVELTVNATENTNCSDLWVNFTCVASEANPAVYNFLLYEKDGDISQSKSGMWIKKISKGGEHVYSCIALHAVGNVTSLNNVTLTVNGKFCVVK